MARAAKMGANGSGEDGGTAGGAGPSRRESPAPVGAMQFPSRRLGLFLGLLVLLEMATHLGFRSPYLYYTEGQYGLEKGNYGSYLGPAGEIIHFDAVNYWPVEYVFSGKYRGDALGTLSRPGYSFLAALLDNYLHPVYAGWAINFLAWWAACLFGHALARGLSASRTAAAAFSLLLATSPGFISMAGQPMGYALGYSLHVIFLACLVCWLPSPKPAAAAGGLLFLLIAADLTYEILGALCLVPFVAWCWTRLGRALTVQCIAGMAAAKLAWEFIVIRGVFDLARQSGLNTRIDNLAEAGTFSWSALPIAAGHLAWGTLIGGFVLVPLLGWISLAEVRGNLLRFCLWGMAAVTLPLFYMGVLGENTGDYAFYKEGRLVAYYYPFLALAAATGLSALSRRLRLSGPAASALPAAVLALHMLSANADWFGIKDPYYVLHCRQGYTIDEILAR